MQCKSEREGFDETLKVDKLNTLVRRAIIEFRTASNLKELLRFLKWKAPLGQAQKDCGGKHSRQRNDHTPRCLEHC
jgi:hypothetical protein